MVLPETVNYVKPVAGNIRRGKLKSLEKKVVPWDRKVSHTQIICVCTDKNRKVRVSDLVAVFSNHWPT